MTATHESRIDPACRDVLDEMEAHVQSCLGSRLCGFEIEFRPGGLILRGRTHSYYVKQLAQHHVMEVAELPVLSNDIEVI
jgi:hypothetical protein